MSACPHPTAALYVDRQRGTTVCTLCGDMVMDQQYELDPVFTRGNRPTGGAGGGLRSLGGSLRPTRATLNVSMPNARPSIDAARRGMLAIARDLEISDDIVEMALGVFKLALGMNAISGTRTVTLCACLYAVCRRERTSHVIYDFAEATRDSPHAILSQMKHICEATHTEVPVVDPSCYVQRFAEQMDLGEHTAEVAVCALKVLRAMRDDWIACGRRPMGVCAAALLVACYVFGIPRNAEQVCGMVRLTSNTITRRLNEFAATPTAMLDSIDDYRRSDDTLPPAFNDSSRKPTEEDVNAGMRELSAMYYELVAEAKQSAPATPERCDKWRAFIQKHCELEGIVPSEENLDLSALSAKDQLHILGLPHTEPLAAQEVELSVKREEERLLVKREASSSTGDDVGERNASLTFKLSQSGNGNGTDALSRLPQSSSHFHSADADDPFAFLKSQVGDLSQPTRGGQSQQSSKQFLSASTAGAATSASTAMNQAGAPGQPAPINFDDPEQFRLLTDQYRHLLQHDPEVRGLRDDFDFNDSAIIANAVAGVSSRTMAANGDVALFGEPTQNTFLLTGASASSQSQSGERGGAGGGGRAGSPTPSAPSMDEEEMRLKLEELLCDVERRHALPWEFIVLQRAELDDTSNLLPYLVLNNEERLRRQKVGEALYKDNWNRGRARTASEISRLEESRSIKRRRRQPPQEPRSITDTLERALRGRGAGTVNVSQIGDLLPGLVDDEVDDAVADDWD